MNSYYANYFNTEDKSLKLMGKPNKDIMTQKEHKNKRSKHSINKCIH
jgi:hypothetical protein